MTFSKSTNIAIITTSTILTCILIGVIVWLSVRNSSQKSKPPNAASTSSHSKQKLPPASSLRELPRVPPALSKANKPNNNSTNSSKQRATLHKNEQPGNKKQAQVMDARQEQRHNMKYERLKPSTNDVEEEQRRVRANKAHVQRREENERQNTPPRPPPPPRKRERQALAHKSQNNYTNTLYKNETLLPAPNSENPVATDIFTRRLNLRRLQGQLKLNWGRRWKNSLEGVYRVLTTPTRQMLQLPLPTMPTILTLFQMRYGTGCVQVRLA